MEDISHLSLEEWDVLVRAGCLPLLPAHSQPLHDLNLTALAYCTHRVSPRSHPHGSGLLCFFGQNVGEKRGRDNPRHSFEEVRLSLGLSRTPTGLLTQATKTPKQLVPDLGDPQAVFYRGRVI